MTTWQEELRGSIRDAAGLRRAVGAGQPAQEIEAVLAEYKMAIPPYYLGLIDWDDPNDPIRLQAVAAPNELVTIPEERHDPIGDIFQRRGDGLYQPHRALPRSGWQ